MLVAGDAVLFLRGDDGVLRLGIRRAVQLKTTPGLRANDFDFTTLVNSISRRSVFNVCYNPRYIKDYFWSTRFTKSWIYDL